MKVLSVDGLCKVYPAFELKNVSFGVEEGRIMGLIGRNGAGKTTTLKCILNLVHPGAGDVRFFGKRFEENELEIRQKIGFVSGGMESYLKKRLDTITDVTRRFYPTWDDAAYRRYMAAFELDGRKTPKELSSGMRVKYALTLALSHHARFLILDEPTSGLDPVSRDELMDIFLSLVREGVSILFSTHITSDLDKCADDITYIRRGEIAASEDMEAFVSRYRLITLDEEPPEAMKAQLIGLKPAKHGYTALANAEAARALNLSAVPADLETIMVHMEKEGEHEEFAL